MAHALLPRLATVRCIRMSKVKPRECGRNWKHDVSTNRSGARISVSTAPPSSSPTRMVCRPDWRSAWLGLAAQIRWPSEIFDGWQHPLDGLPTLKIDREFAANRRKSGRGRSDRLRRLRSRSCTTPAAFRLTVLYDLSKRHAWEYVNEACEWWARNSVLLANLEKKCCRNRDNLFPSTRLIFYSPSTLLVYWIHTGDRKNDRSELRQNLHGQSLMSYDV